MYKFNKHAPFNVFFPETSVFDHALIHAVIVLAEIYGRGFEVYSMNTFFGVWTCRNQT